MRLKAIALLLIAIMALILPGCETPAQVGSSSSTSTSVENPIIGQWKMTRESIEPKLDIPDVVLNMYLNNDPVWNISKSSISYDGRDKWFTIPSFGLTGVTLESKPTSALLGYPDAKSGTYSGGGTINVSRVNSILGLTPRLDKINAMYEDKVTVTSLGPNSIKATLQVNLKSGGYWIDVDGVMEPRNLGAFSATISYSGVRK